MLFSNIRHRFLRIKEQQLHKITDIHQSHWEKPIAERKKYQRKGHNSNDLSVMTKELKISLTQPLICAVSQRFASQEPFVVPCTLVLWLKIKMDGPHPAFLRMIGGNGKDL